MKQIKTRIFSHCPNSKCFSLQSFLDLFVSMLLLVITVTIHDMYMVRSSGILGIVECYMWNSQIFLWAGFVASSWNIVSMTFER